MLLLEQRSLASNEDEALILVGIIMSANTVDAADIFERSLISAKIVDVAVNFPDTVSFHKTGCSMV